MQIDTFKRQFRQLNGVTLEDSWVLFRRPLQLYNLEAEATISFENLDDALSHALDGVTLGVTIGAGDGGCLTNS